MSNIFEIDSMFTNLKQKVIDLESDMMEERKAQDATIASLREENERLKAVLEGAQYQNIDNLKNESVEKCRAIGSTAALLTINLRARCEAAERELEQYKKVVGMLHYSEMIGGWVLSEAACKFNNLDIAKMKESR